MRVGTTATVIRRLHVSAARLDSTPGLNRRTARRVQLVGLTWIAILLQSVMLVGSATMLRQAYPCAQRVLRVSSMATVIRARHVRAVAWATILQKWQFHVQYVLLASMTTILILPRRVMEIRRHVLPVITPMRDHTLVRLVSLGLLTMTWFL